VIDYYAVVSSIEACEVNWESHDVVMETNATIMLCVISAT